MLIFFIFELKLWDYETQDVQQKFVRVFWSHNEISLDILDE
jgi:Fe-S oxidoreductase